jgi:hypothetical protein
MVLSDFAMVLESIRDVRCGAKQVHAVSVAAAAMIK